MISGRPFSLLACQPRLRSIIGRRHDARNLHFLIIILIGIPRGFPPRLKYHLRLYRLLIHVVGLRRRYRRLPHFLREDPDLIQLHHPLRVIIILI